MIPFQEIIRRKRDGAALGPGEIDAMVAGIANGGAGDGQVAAFAMAVFLNGMNTDETVRLTQAMRDTGEVIDWDRDRFSGPIVDKHSTGGVGDKVSLMLAPIVAACGGYVPMISGRGLGHTGGTLDKLDSIPGYQSTPDIETFKRVVAEVGCAIIGQTSDLAPADRRLYAVRDVTATVESIPLITASILSKKLAAGLDGLVMDVKTGAGAFMAKRSDARDLAHAIVDAATGAGVHATALITNMDQVLGTTAGNALEVRETIDYLTGHAREARLDRVVRALGREMLLTGGLATDNKDADAKIAAALDGGRAAERFEAMVPALGGPRDLLSAPDRHLPTAPVTLAARPSRDGVIRSIDVRAVGLAVVGLGGGRNQVEDSIDPAVGLSEVKSIGVPVSSGDPLAIVHARGQADAERAMVALAEAFNIGDAADAVPPVVIERIEADK
ncbi:MAG: thymidine phosphorylase [Alphaproteobacteria bacterium]|nr:thymidine phosphorylase [Alphaproteobacteria bacterium]